MASQQIAVALATNAIGTGIEKRPQNVRKACDLCFAKKIKCNMLKPECSNCMLYRTECRTTTIRRRAGPPRPRASTKSIPDAQENSKKVKQRHDKIERQFQRLTESTKTVQVQASAASTSPTNGGHNSSIQNNSSGCLPWIFDPVKPTLYQGLSNEDLTLPPLHDIMPIIDHYFDACNSVIPLFSEAHFMPLIARWYGKSPKRDRATWAAILVVIALGSRSLIPGSSDPEELVERENYCMRNAQSVMSELVTRDEDLLGIQVLLALVMLFYNCSDLRPASILSSTAMRLVHRLQLQSSSSAQHFTAEEVQQRSRVFWNAYILDKDISLRAKLPSVQCNADIDIPLPPMVQSDGTGLIKAKDGHSQLNFLRLRLDLAHIEGKIYDLLYSCGSNKVQGAERQRRIVNLQAMLDRWNAQIPPAFKIDKVSITVSDEKIIEITKLYHTYLLCITSTHGVYSNQADWMRRVSSLSRVAIQDFATALQGPRVATCMNQDPPLAGGWNHCVEISRASMKLFQYTRPTGSLIWQCSCVHFSGLIIILANILISPTHESTSDLQIATKSIHLFEQILDVIQSPAYEPLHRIVMDLYKSAASVVDEARLDGLNEADNFYSNLTGRTEGDLDIFTEGTAFPEFQ